KQRYRENRQVFHAARSLSLEVGCATLVVSAQLTFNYRLRLDAAIAEPELALVNFHERLPLCNLLQAGIASPLSFDENSVATVQRFISISPPVQRSGEHF